GRSNSNRCLRLPGLLLDLLYRRGGEKPGADNPPLDHDQRHRGRGNLPQRESVYHRSGALAGSCSAERHQADSYLEFCSLSVYGESLWSQGVNSVHDNGVMDSICICVCPAPELLTHTLRCGSGWVFLPYFWPSAPPVSISTCVPVDVGYPIDCLRAIFACDSDRGSLS